MRANELKDAAKNWVAALDGCGLDRSLIREIFTVLFWLRYIDQLDAEEEARAVFEDRPYQPLLVAPFGLILAKQLLLIIICISKPR